MTHECDGTAFVVCPHCGYEHVNCAEWMFGDEVYHERRECDTCGKIFLYSRIISVTYSACKVMEEAKP